jgi:vacuolar-type H+-ATPase subunit E/Vma4
MNNERLKLIVRNLDLLVQSLKEELEDIPEVSYESTFSYIENDVDEYYVEGDEDV